MEDDFGYEADQVHQTSNGIYDGSPDDFEVVQDGASQGEGRAYASLEELPAEPAALDVFMAEWEKKLEEKRRMEAEHKQEAIDKARQLLVKHAEEREMMREKKQSNNRKAEQVKLEKLEADLEADNAWERVVNLVDMQSEASKADMGRIKQIFIQLKNEPIKAEA